MRAKIVGCVLGVVILLATSGCGFSPYKLPLPGGADLGDRPYTVKIHFRDVLDLVPQSAVRVNDIAVGKVTDIKLDGWTAIVTVKVNKDSKLPDNAEATIRQTSLLGEKFVSLAPPPTGATGRLGNGDSIPLDRTGRNPEIEEVLGAASLLFNGGGLEKTNTIIKELNNALGGNEPEVKELIDSTSTFLTQLDTNKEAILTSLEKVNGLAVAANKQKGAITGALDNLPAALKVVNDQRDDLVKLLQSLDRLSDVATGVIRQSKADTIADLKALTPILENLTAAGDDLPRSVLTSLTFPFSDGFVGGSYAKASGRCIDAAPGVQEVKEGACYGDFANLSINVDLGVDQLKSILSGFDLPGLLTGGAAAPGAAAPAAPTSPGAALPALPDLMPGLVPKTGLPDLPSLAPSGKPTAAATTPSPAASTKAPTGLCALLRTCRPAAASSSSADDLRRLLVEPVVAR